jgi:hypothetical protein
LASGLLVIFLFLDDCGIFELERSMQCGHVAWSVSGGSVVPIFYALAWVYHDSSGPEPNSFQQEDFGFFYSTLLHTVQTFLRAALSRFLQNSICNSTRAEDMGTVTSNRGRGTLAQARAEPD